MAATIVGVGIVALPIATERTVDARTRALIDAETSGDPRREADAIARPSPFGWLADSTEIAADWRRANDAPGLKQRLVDAWLEATGPALVCVID